MSDFPDDAFAAETFVEKEKGRFVVYLEVHFWENATEGKVATYRHRIQEYSTQRKAEIAAEIIRRAANRDIKYPPGS